MKNRIFKSILALLLILVSMPIAANDYLKIYFKDGHTERHYMKLVDNISVTKYDLEGNLHSDYQMQQIVMADTTYSYYLSDIESMAFAKVEEDELEKNVESVENNVTPIFEQCSTVEEMEAHLDEIKAIASVEDAWRDGSDIVVQVRDWHKVFYKFPLVPENYDNLVAGFAKSLKKNKQLLARKADGTMLKVAIAFQMTDDSRFDDEEEGLLELRNKFAKMGFDAHFIPDEKTGETLDVDFYRRRIFDYDIVFLATHGKYSDGKHYFFTSKKTSLKEDVIMETIDAVTDLDDISVGFCNTGKYLVNFGTFVIVSEDYIKKSGYRFKGSGPHIVFNAACQSLYGGDVLSREHNGVKESYYGSDAVAKVFFDKGADLYIGATNLTYNARLAGISFFHYMLDGASEDCAFNLLEPKYKYEEKSKHKSALVDLYNPKSKFGNLKSLFLNDVQTEEKDNQDINKEYKENGHVVLEGKVSPLYEKNSGLSFGFRLASESGVDELDSYETLPSNNADYSGLDPWEIVFSSTYTPEQGKTYYYRAYIYDGSHYNWGEERSFKIEAQQADEKQVMLTQNVGGTTYEIYKINTDKNDYHINPDGWKCYKSSLMLDMTKNGKTSTYTLDDNIYLDSSESHHGGQRPCLYISSSSDQLFVFINSKDSHNNYTMDGYAYRTSLSNVSFTRETVFTGRNWGWSPYFTYSDGVLSVQHFSYAGYYAMTSYRNSDGTWTTQQGSSIKPDAFNEQSEQAGNVLIDDNPGLTLSQTQLSIVAGSNTTVEITSGSGEYGVTNLNSSIAKATLQGTTITISALSEGNAKVVATDMQTGQKIIIEITVTIGGDIVAYTSCPDSHHPHLIDLGLPSGTKWACCNVGAEKPEDYGGYFAWGETTEKSSYTSGNYLDGKGISYDIGKDIAGTQYDAATANWGSPWVMPSKDQMEELKNNCTSEWTTENGVNGRRFTGPNGASIFLPAAGGRWKDDLYYAGSDGRYWSSSLYESGTSYVWGLYFGSGYVYTDYYYGRDGGQGVRPVCKN